MIALRQKMTNLCNFLGFTGTKEYIQVSELEKEFMLISIF